MKHSFGIAGGLNTLFLLMTHCVRHAQEKVTSFFGSISGGGSTLEWAPSSGSGPQLWSSRALYSQLPLSSLALCNQAHKTQCQSGCENYGCVPAFIPGHFIIASHPRHPFPCSQKTQYLISNLLGERGISTEWTGLGEAWETHLSTVVIELLLSARWGRALLWPGWDTDWQAPTLCARTWCSWAAVQKPRAFLGNIIALRPLPGYLNKTSGFFTLSQRLDHFYS